MMKPNDYTCPFCGHASKQILGPKTRPQTSAHGRGYQVECINCAARGPAGFASERDAMQAFGDGDMGYRRIVKEERSK